MFEKIPEFDKGFIAGLITELVVITIFTIIGIIKC